MADDTKIYMRAEGILNFPRLDEPDPKSDKYQCDLILNKDTTDTKAFEKNIKAAMVNAWGKDAKKWPMTHKSAVLSFFKDGDTAIIKKSGENKCDKYPEYKNSWWIVPKTGYQDSFQVVNHDGVVIEDLGRKSLLKSGNIVVISIALHAYENEYGAFVSVYLGNIFRKAEGNPITVGGPSALSEFDDLIGNTSEVEDDDAADDDESFLG